MASVGFSTTLLTIVLSLIPAAEEPNKILAVVKIVGLTGLVLVVGVLLYFLGKGNAVRAAALSKQTIGTGLPPGVH
jgi:predicted cation transporter